ncbi:MAG: DUF4247 domain-containing protein [Bacillaceae bacterium]|nr:DUF4247 domain-containing protein [Bacillaceae bacterium]
MIRLLAVVLSVVLLLTGCGAGVSNLVSDRYPLEDVVYGDRGYEARVYRASDTSVQQVVDMLAQEYPPVEISREDPERMFMVYQNRLVHVMQDAQDPDDSLIEVADKEFVRDHYDLSLLEAYIMLNILEDIFEWNLKRKQYQGTGYGGYVGPGGRYARTGGGTGSVKYGSIHGPNPRGGGPSAGK